MLLPSSYHSEPIWIEVSVKEVEGIQSFASFGWSDKKFYIDLYSLIGFVGNFYERKGDAAQT